jgi:hypothetical protein
MGEFGKAYEKVEPEKKRVKMGGSPTGLFVPARPRTDLYSTYFRPDGISSFFRPDGASVYVRPE